jgi:hypothetical protein
LKSIKTALGDDKIALDAVSTSKRVLVSGSQGDYDAALAIISAQQSGLATDAAVSAPSPSTERVCSAEWSINPLPRHPCPVDVELLAGHQSPVDVEQPDCKLRGMEMEWLAVAKVG